VKVCGKEKTDSINLGLAVICAISPPGHCWTQQDIAEVCGCHHRAIQKIEERALRKLRRSPQMLALLEQLKK